jgi:hypothetical protein
MYKKPGMYLSGEVLGARRTYGAVAELVIVPSELLTSIPDIAIFLCPRKRLAADGLNDLPNHEPVADFMSREAKTLGSQSHRMRTLALSHVTRPGNLGDLDRRRSIRSIQRAPTERRAPIVISVSAEIPHMRVGAWCERNPSKRNCLASLQSKGSFHPGPFVAQPRFLSRRLFLNGPMQPRFQSTR